LIAFLPVTSSKTIIIIFIKHYTQYWVTGLGSGFRLVPEAPVGVQSWTAPIAISFWAMLELDCAICVLMPHLSLKWSIGVLIVLQYNLYVL
jgi:hypothetical protein